MTSPAAVSSSRKQLKSCDESHAGTGCLHTAPASNRHVEWDPYHLSAVFPSLKFTYTSIKFPLKQSHH